tara:strand:- start:7138 stop:7467 length:330 start_codon:yes stop_codon:yes gene_type:complete
MGRRKNKQKRQGRKWQSLEQCALIPNQIREEKAQQVRISLSNLGLDDNLREIKKLYIILDLWVKHHREHQELLDLPNTHRKLEIRLFNSKNIESKVVLKYNSSYVTDYY